MAEPRRRPATCLALALAAALAACQDGAVGQATDAASVVPDFYTDIAGQAGDADPPDGADAGATPADIGNASDAPAVDASLADADGEGAGDADGADSADTDAANPADGDADAEAGAADAVASPFVWQLGADQVKIAWSTLPDGRRAWQLSTTHPLRDDLPAGGKLAFVEAPGAARVRSPHPGFDAAFALAQHERALASVSALSDGGWNGGQPVPCACWQTGEKWTWAWTRDAAYAIALGLAGHDPQRSADTLRFLIAKPKAGASASAPDTPRILQDTGTGGSWPVSTDRLAWALGARAVAAALPKAQRAAWWAEVAPILQATLDDDAALVAGAGGLWPGETSFTDWREQSYPPWTAARPTAIARTRALSTNVLALVALETLATALAAQPGANVPNTPAGLAAAKAKTRAEQQRAALKAAFAAAPGVPLPSLKGEDGAPIAIQAPPAWLGGPLDATAAARTDLLALSLATLAALPPVAASADWLRAWPMAPSGPPVLWPQSPEAPIYHNRASWPFVTAFAALAADKAGVPTTRGRATLALVRQALLNLSNLENYAWPGGENWRSEGPTSGPVVNSRRQLWSVAGMLGVVERSVFGVERDPTLGLSVWPRLPRGLVHALWPQGGELLLEGLPVAGGKIDVRLTLPPGVGDGEGVLAPTAATRAGLPWTADAWLAEDDAKGVVTPFAFALHLAPSGGDNLATPAPLVDPAAPAVQWLAPPTPTLAPVKASESGVELTWSQPAGPVAAFEVLRAAAGAMQVVATLDAAALSAAGKGLSYVDAVAKGGIDATSGLAFCWTVRAISAQGLRSHHAEPQCDWGPGFERIQTVSAWAFVGDAPQPSPTFVAGPAAHHNGFGIAGGKAVLSAIAVPDRGGPHVLEVRYRNERPVQTGYGALPLQLEVRRVRDDALLGEALLALGQTGAGQGFVVAPALEGLTLHADEAIRVALWRRPAGGMTGLQRSLLYDGPGGKEAGAAAAVPVDVAGVQLLARSAAPKVAPAFAFDGSGDFDVLPAAGTWTPGAPLAPWERVGLHGDARHLHGAVVSQGFEDPARAYLLYLEAIAPGPGEAAPPPQPAPGMKYLGQTPSLPFTAACAVGLRSGTDLGDGYGPWAGLHCREGGVWRLVARLQPGVDLFVAADKHTVAFRLPRGALGPKALQPGTLLRVTGHLVHAVAGQEWKGLLPPSATPWQGSGGGYLELPWPLGGPMGPAVAK